MQCMFIIRPCMQMIAINFLRFSIVIVISISPLLEHHIEANEGADWKELYIECIEGNCVDGNGTMIYNSTQKYVGEFKGGKRNGQGALYLPFNRVRVGTWRNDELIEGTSILPDGTRYIGQWKYGYRHGKGQLIYTDGREYSGEFHSGQRHGQGTIIYPDGRVYTGKFKDGKRTGFGTMRYPDGRKIAGQFLDGELVKSEASKSKISN